MTSNNQVVLIGHVGNDITQDLRQLQNGEMVADVCLGIDRPFKDASGNTVTDWISCEFWNKKAQILSEYVKKGDLLSVIGSLRVDHLEANGDKHRKVYISGDDFQMFGSKRRSVDPQLLAESDE